MTDKNIELSFVLPCLNEVKTIEVCVNKCKQATTELGIESEIIIADNGSTDGSIELAEKLGCKVVNVERKGYGSALLGGIAAASGDYIIMGDADDSYDFSKIEPFITNLREGYDIVIGNRFKGGIEDGAMPPLHRYLGNPVLSFLGRIFYNTKIGDFHCGLRGFNRERINELNLRCSGMEFASEMICKAVMKDYSIFETPIKLHPDGRDRKPHLRSWRDGWRHLRFLLLHSPNWLFLYPGLVLAIIGIIGGTALTFNPIKIGSITLDVHSLIYFATAFIIGLQMLSLWVLTRLFHNKLYTTDKTMPFHEHITLEKGLILGGLLLLLGLGGSFYSIAEWQQNSFGNLDPQLALRTVIPSVTALISGGLIIVNALTLGVIESLMDLK